MQLSFRLVLIVSAILALSAITFSQEVKNYKCGGGTMLRADFTTGSKPTARIRYGTQDFTLPLVRSASGSKYLSKGTMFWTKGDSATLESKVLNDTCEVTTEEVPFMTLSYSCGKGGSLVADFDNFSDPRTAKVKYKGKSYSLLSVMADSGSKYKRAGTTFWTHQKEANFDAKGIKLKCTQN